MAIQSPQAEVYPLFREQTAGPFQSNSTEQNDLQYIQRFGPRSTPVDVTGFGRNFLQDSVQSALSAPDNFIADGYFRRIVRHHFGNKRWPLVVLVCSVLASAAATASILGVSPFNVTRFASELSKPVAAISATSRSPLRTSRPAESTVPFSTENRPGKSVAVPDIAADLEQRFSTSGLPQQTTKHSAEAPVKVIAFPPAVPLEADGQASVASADQAPPAGAKPEAVSAAKAPPIAPVASRHAQDTRKLDQLVGRGEQLLAQGEVAAARLFFERAASEGDPRGARGLARSYDENALRTLSIVGLEGSPTEAERWYLKAAELEAQQARRTSLSGSAER
jgi:hypothetical protein